MTGFIIFIAVAIFYVGYAMGSIDGERNARDTQRFVENWERRNKK